MQKPTTKLYGMPIHVGSETGTKIDIITDSKEPYLIVSQQIYDLLVIAGGKEFGWSSDEIDEQLTRPRDDLFKSLANQEFFIELKKRVRILKQERLMNFNKQRESDKIIAVDFDGTIVEHRFPEIGKECPSALMCLRQWKAEGVKLILWTMRSGVHLVEAVEWCRQRGLTFSAINHGINDTAWTTSNKAYADVYIDDMAIGCPMIDFCRMVDWSKVGPMVDKTLKLGEFANDH